MPVAPSTRSCDQSRHYLLKAVWTEIVGRISRACLANSFPRPVQIDGSRPVTETSRPLLRATLQLGVGWGLPVLELPMAGPGLQPERLSEQSDDEASTAERPPHSPRGGGGIEESRNPSSRALSLNHPHPSFDIVRALESRAPDSVTVLQGEGERLRLPTRL